MILQDRVDQQCESCIEVYIMRMPSSLELELSREYDELIDGPEVGKRRSPVV